MKALIVDDDAVAGDYIVKLLKRIDRNWLASVAKNGAEAIAEINKQIHQLVVLDLQLPDCYGLDICREIRKKHNSAETKILILSGFLTPQIEKAIINDGADDYLPKNFDLQDFMDKINNLFPIENS